MNSFGGKKPQTLGPAIRAFLKQSRLSAGMNSHLVFSAWDEVTGAGACTLKKFFRDGKLYVTMSSSVYTSQLVMQRDIIIQRINEYLSAHPLFITDTPGAAYVKELTIR